MKKFLTIVASAIAISAVGTLPSVAMAQDSVYQPAGANGGAGYTSASLGGNQYVVVFTGEARTKKTLAAQYALLRAAELTEESGYEWFAVLSSTVKTIEQGGEDDIASRSGAFIGNTMSASGSAGGSGSGPAAGNSAGGGDGNVQMGPSTGGFGGGDVPPSVLERWKPKKVVQAALIIQMGSGDEAKFEGVKKQPDIFEAKSTVEEIRSTMK
ncbi:hypothetical protein ABAC460_12960 [Asticcacaulis sp. AC460]|uniref:CC0125/CC1285 family lipoprotein n=1 Tax=Asticcacaulis sp. AC460 TaxID=1282360 RepID=UPI0003C3FD80|nr:hypothetical protein [Asticcacaulis sp. AC460]ESQ89415.1 hypothetical protein ABAC460_12960 [Asticcacaulis sp. AC460]